MTVDMIATGTDVKPLECLLFMRDVRSRNYFEQMKGRGTRTLGHDDLRKGHPLGSHREDPLRDRGCRGGHQVAQDREPVAHHQTIGAAQGSGHGRDDGRSRRRHGERPWPAASPGSINNSTRRSRNGSRRKAGGIELTRIVGDLLAALDPDRIDEKAREIEPVFEGRQALASGIRQGAGTVGG